MTLFDRLKQVASENPTGFTVKIPNLEPVTTGWVVAMKETQNSFGDEGLQRVIEVAQRTTQIVGGWKEGDLFYWDASFIVQSEKEAVQIGIENGQIAIFNLDTFEVKYL